MKVFIQGLPPKAHSLIGQFVGSSALSWAQQLLVGPSQLWHLAEALRDTLLAAEVVSSLVALQEQYRAAASNVIPNPSTPRLPST